MKFYCNADDKDGVVSLIAALKLLDDSVKSQDVEIHRHEITATISLAIEISISGPEIIAIIGALIAYLNRNKQNWISNHLTRGKLVRSDSPGDLPALLEDCLQSKSESE